MLPFLPFQFCFLLTFLLSSLVLVLFSLLLLLELPSSFIALASFHVVLVLALVFLGNHLLGLGDPLDVLDVSLLNFVVTHATIEFFLDLTLLLD